MSHGWTYFTDATTLLCVQLGANSFSGTIPKAIADISLVINLDYMSNNISGTIPQEFSRLLYLNVLRSGNNSLSGTVPSSLFTLKQLSNIDLSLNPNLTGPLPENMGCVMHPL